LKHRALPAVVAPDEQVKLCKVVDLFANALEIAEGQSSNHATTAFPKNVGRISQSPAYSFSKFPKGII
jgi:hypothetical protein